MKKIKYILLLIILIPFTAKAYEIECPAGPFKYQDTFECTITGDNEHRYDELSGSIQFDDNSLLTCSIETPTNGFEEVTGDNDAAFYYKGTSSTNELVKIKCEVTSKADSSKREQLIIPNLKYHIYDSNTDASNEILRSREIFLSEYVEPVDPNKVEKPRDTSNPSVRLKEISDENLDFTFSSFKTSYDISVLFDVNQLNLKIVPNNEAATYEIIGSQSLEIGDNTIDIMVTSPDGTRQLCYTLNIKRLKRGEEIYYPEKDSSLKSLTIEGFPINFESIILDYNIHLKYDVSSINVTAVPTYEGAKVSVSRTEDLNNGDIVEVVVESGDSSSHTTYMINITKDAPPKDYRATIYISAFVVAITIVIFIILKTNRSNKKNPLLKKKEKEEQTVENKEEVPTENIQPAEEVAPVVEQNVNTINLDNAAEPIETATPVDNNFNVATSNVTTLDLSNAQLPSELTPTVIPNGEEQVQDNNQQ